MIYDSIGGVIDALDRGLEDLSEQLELISRCSHGARECKECVKNASENLGLIRSNLETLKDLHERLERLL